MNNVLQLSLVIVYSMQNADKVHCRSIKYTVAIFEQPVINIILISFKHILKIQHLTTPPPPKIFLGTLTRASRAKSQNFPSPLSICERGDSVTSKNWVGRPLIPWPRPVRKKYAVGTTAFPC